MNPAILSKIYKDAYAPIFGIMLFTALDLNLPTLLLEPKTLSDLSELTFANQAKLDHMLKILSVHGYFSYNEQTQQWSNSPSSAALTDDSLSKSMKLLLWPYKYEYLSSYPESIKHQISCHDVHFGFDYFSGIMNNREILPIYRDGVNAMENLFISRLRDIGLGECQKVLELAGGEGNLMVYLAEQYPHITGAVLERYEVIDMIQKNIYEHNLQERIMAINGDMLGDLPTDYDCIIIKHSLCEWDNNCVKNIISNARKALQAGGKFKWMDKFAVENSKKYLHTTIHEMEDIRTIRTLEESQNLLTECGFRVEKIENSLRDEFINIDMEVNPASEYIIHSVAI
ncbi:unnamed protein product [Blepharisma stoltei]|uniref:O-methyltransferase C-terminal domain-containing protein n=1 Tax=Blepharisma stoltei TaxID=1481888 RepID=A0AAU9KHS8_9CILI|nr:unnamed protein product [Blepharisma stoltei]